MTGAVLEQSRDAHSRCLHRLCLRADGHRDPEGLRVHFPRMAQQEGRNSVGTRRVCGSSSGTQGAGTRSQTGAGDLVTDSTSELTAGALTD